MPPPETSELRVLWNSLEVIRLNIESDKVQTDAYKNEVLPLLESVCRDLRVVCSKIAMAEAEAAR